MAITNFVITTNGAGYAESDGLNPIASTESTAVIKNNILSIVLSDGSSWKNTPLENCTLGGSPLSTDPRIAIDQLALAGFRTPSGGSGGGAVDSWNGQTGNVVYGVLRKTDGITPADSYSENIRHNAYITSVTNANQPASRLLKLDVGEAGASNPHGQVELYKYGAPFSGFGLDLGCTIWGYGNNDGVQQLSLIGATLSGNPLPNTNEIIGFWNGTNKLGSVLGSGKFKIDNYGLSTFIETSVNNLGVNTDGEIIEKINNEGQVKANSFGGSEPTLQGFVENTERVFDLTGLIDFSPSPTTQFPQNITSPIDSDFVDQSNGQLLENPIEGQEHIWRIIYDYSNFGTNNNLSIDLELFNPLNGFKAVFPHTKPSGSTSKQGVEALINTVADSNSIGNGYQLRVVTSSSDGNGIVTIKSIKRTSLIKNIR